MQNLIFSIFPNQNFVDLGLFQFGWERCTPAHSFGPAARNHYLFHYILSGTGTLMADDSKGVTQTYSITSMQGFMIFPNQITTYVADKQLPWEYVWLEFDGLRVKSLLDTIGLSLDKPVYHARNKSLREDMANEMLYISRHKDESPFHLIGHLYLFLDYLLRSAADEQLEHGSKLREFYIHEALTYIEHNFQNEITIEDIAKSYMDVYDSRIISKAGTPFHNIVETLDGDMIHGDMDEEITSGKCLIAAANPDLMESYIEKDDIVILGNRYESQLCAIEMGAKCIIVCDGALVSYTISRLAESRGCYIIKTPYDTFTASRLINQSIPIRFFMKSENLITFGLGEYLDDIRDTMAKKRYRDFPILDWNENYFGMISRRSLLGARKKKLILVDHNELTQAVDGMEEAEIIEIIDHHRIGSIETMGPVFFRNQPLGCTATIIYQMYRESGVELTEKIAGLLCSAILSDTLIYRSPTCTQCF